MRTGLERVFGEGDGRNVIVVGHGGGFLLTVLELCPVPDFGALVKLGNPNCAITEMEITRQDGGLRGRLIQWGSISHLSGEAAQLVPGLPEREGSV